eukprot:TRINITY_DN8965_c0_g1_i1.p1 TRINITY_DN8965_c0_g1~~TRINITY_DN8965_c0_g1_i1.p1  ORF type:complete len:669 (-),score=258.69 TRINITY_DN8965_c0_g1_i1:189-2195(-)
MALKRRDLFLLVILGTGALFGMNLYLSFGQIRHPDEEDIFSPLKSPNIRRYPQSTGSNDDSIKCDEDFIETHHFVNNKTGKKKDIIVCMYDGGTPFGWGDGQHTPAPNYAGWDVDKGECPVNCHFTTDRRLYHSADALLFDTCLTGPVEHREVPPYLPEKQRGQPWIWFAYEQEVYFPMMREQEYMKRFDYRMTYHHESLTQISFTCPWGQINTFLDPPPKKSKDKVVVFMASNCNTGGATERTEYVKELMKYVKVDSYGHCLHNTDMKDYQRKNGRRSHGDKIIEKIGIMKEYKFMLAFENTNRVPDYVTEKMTNAIQAGTVPVYWGNPTTIDKWTIGNKSIIKTHDFASPKELGEYLSYLNEHDDEYMSYFDWKQQGMSAQYRRHLANCYVYAECRLCKRLAEMQRPEWDTDEPIESRLQPRDVKAYGLSMNCISCRLDRHDQYVQLPPHDALNLEDDYTLVAWFKYNVIQDGRIIDKSSAGNFDGYAFDVIKTHHDSGGKGKLRLCAGDGCLESNREIGIGVWYHGAVSFRSGKDGVKFYINGHHDRTGTSMAKTRRNGFHARIGRAAAGGGSWRPYHQATIFDGEVDSVSIWGRVLSENDIWQLMYVKPIGDEPNLVAFYSFNEGEGNIAHDISPNKIHGQLIGDPQWIRSISKPLNDIAVIEH